MSGRWRTGAIVVVVVLALVPAAWGHGWGISGYGKRTKLSEVAGEVILSGGEVTERSIDWNLSVSSRTSIKLIEGKRRGDCLSYNREGGEQTVSMAGKGKKWEVVKDGKGYVIMAAEGKCRGYCLAAGGNAERNGKDIGEKVILTKDHKKALRFSVYEISN